MIHNGPKCEKCKSLITPETPHMMHSYKPYCLKCSRDLAHADPKKLKDGETKHNPLPKDGNTGASGKHLNPKTSYKPDKDAGKKPSKEALKEK